MKFVVSVLSFLFIFYYDSLGHNSPSIIFGGKSTNFSFFQQQKQ